MLQDILVTAPKLREDEIGTLTGNVDIPLPGAERINPGHGTKIARGLVRYKGEKGSFNSSHLYLYLVSPLVPHKMSQHQNCKRCPSTSLYEFRCV